MYLSSIGKLFFTVSILSYFIYYGNADTVPLSSGLSNFVESAAGFHAFQVTIVFIFLKINKVFHLEHKK